MNIIKELAKVNIIKKRKEENQDFLHNIKELEKKKIKDSKKLESLKESKGQKFKKHYGFSKSTKRIMRKYDLDPFIFNVEKILDEYRRLRKERKKAQRKLQKEKLKLNQQFRRNNPRKKIKGGGKNKGKQNKQGKLGLEVKKAA